MILGPGSPPQTILDQTDTDGTRAPRVREYGVSANLMFKPRSEEPTRSPFDMLRALSANYDVAAICQTVLCNEIYALDWAIVPVDQTDPNAKIKYGDDMKKVTAFLTRPDGDNYFDEWATMLLREDLEIGAPVIFKRRNRRRTKVLALEGVQGDTFKPVIDIRGKTVAFQQIYRGLPGNIYPASEIVYRPRLRRRDSAYGISPMELIILNTNSALRKQTFDLAYYQNGTVPELLMGLDPEKWTLDDIKDFQEWFDDLLAGNDAARSRIRFYPGDPSKAKEFKVHDPATEQQEWMLRITCAIFNVAPEEIGFTMQVNKATAGQQQETQARKGITPIVKWMEGMMSAIIQLDLGHPELAFKYMMKPGPDYVKAQAAADTQYIANSTYSPAYVRNRDGITLSNDDVVMVAEANARKALLHPELALAPVTPGAHNQPGQAKDPVPAATAQNVANNGKGTPAPASPEATEGKGKASASDSEDAKPKAATKAVSAYHDMRLWRNKALKKVKEGKSAAFEFDSEMISPELIEALKSSLARVQTTEEVREVFALALAGEQVQE